MATTVPVLFNVSGPYGVGKDSLLAALIQAHGKRVYRVRTLTTRPASANADPTYETVTEAVFQETTGKGRWIIGWQLGRKYAYGTSLDEIESEAACGKLCVHSVYAAHVGSGRLREAFGARLVSIGMVATHEDLETEVRELERRMIARGRENLSEIKTRTAHQKEIVGYVLSNPCVETPDGPMRVFDRVVVNEVLNRTIAEVLELVKTSFGSIL